MDKIIDKAKSEYEAYNDPIVEAIIDEAGTKDMDFAIVKSIPTVVSKLLESAREEGAFKAEAKIMANWVLLSHDEYKRLNSLAEQSEEKG